MKITAPYVDDDISIDIKTKNKDSINTTSTTESINSHDDLSLPKVKLTKATPPTLPEDYDVASPESTNSSFDLSVPEVKPTKVIPPLLDDDSDFNSMSIAGTLNFDEISSLHTNQESINVHDLSNAKSTIVKNNKHILDIELNLDSIQDRINSINDEYSSLLQEKADLTNKLNNNSHNVVSFNERTINNDNPLYTTYKNAYNSFIQ
jgi:uncharacterized protein YqfB (UPF0267 family)